MQQILVRIGIIVMGFIYIFLIPSEPTIVKLIFKVIPIALIIYYAYIQSQPHKTLTHNLVIIGLLFSIVADGSIIYSFIAGLIFFFIAHVFYIGAFARQFQFSILRASSIIPLILVSIWIGNGLINGLQQNKEEDLLIPVLLYIIIIMTMCWLAIMTKNIWATIGSILFVISDSILAWNKFVTPITNEEALVMITYYAAQLFIAHSLRTLVQKKERTI